MQKSMKLLWETDIRSGVFDKGDNEMWQKRTPPPSEKYYPFLQHRPQGLKLTDLQWQEISEYQADQLKLSCYYVF